MFVWCGRAIDSILLLCNAKDRALQALVKMALVQHGGNKVPILWETGAK